MGEPLSRKSERQDAGVSPRELAIRIARLLISKRAEDVAILDVSDQIQIASYFILATGSSSRAIQTMAEVAEKQLRKAGLGRLGVDGTRQARWVCIDYGEVVVHIFDRDAREFYDLDHLWGDAPRVPFESSDSEAPATDA